MSQTLKRLDRKLRIIRNDLENVRQRLDVQGLDIDVQAHLWKAMDELKSFNENLF